MNPAAAIWFDQVELPGRLAHQLADVALSAASSPGAGREMCLSWIALLFSSPCPLELLRCRGNTAGSKQKNDPGHDLDGQTDPVGLLE